MPPNARWLATADWQLSTSGPRPAPKAVPVRPTSISGRTGEPGEGREKYRAYHSSELAYVFGTLGLASRPFTADDYALSSRAMAYWTQFIKTGNPYGLGLPRWPRFDPRSPQLMRLDVRTAPEPILAPRKRRAFERYESAGGRLGLF